MTTAGLSNLALPPPNSSPTMGVVPQDLSDPDTAGAPTISVTLAVTLMTTATPITTVTTVVARYQQPQRHEQHT